MRCYCQVFKNEKNKFNLCVLISFNLLPVSGVATQTTYYESYYDSTAAFAYTDPVLACSDSLANFKIIYPNNCGYSEAVYDFTSRYCSWTFNLVCTNTLDYRVAPIGSLTCTDPQVPTLLYSGTSWYWGCGDPTLTPDLGKTLVRYRIA